jgi:hypothetical protein
MDEQMAKLKTPITRLGKFTAGICTAFEIMPRARTDPGGATVSIGLTIVAWARQYPEQADALLAEDPLIQQNALSGAHLLEDFFNG